MSSNYLISILGRLFSTISTLTLIPSSSLHKKRFTCEAIHPTLTSNVEGLKTSFDIEVTSPPSLPKILGYPSNFRLINGSRLSLSCQSKGGYPLGRLSWYRLESNTDSLNLIDNSFVVRHQEELTENNLTMIVSPTDNNVTLICQVSNSYLYSLGQRYQSNITVEVACE